MPIRLDISPSSVVAYCTDCGHWRSPNYPTVDEARQRAAEHEERVHPESRLIRRQLEQNARRKI
jgi:hypothetical protein